MIIGVGEEGVGGMELGAVQLVLLIEVGLVAPVLAPALFESAIIVVHAPPSRAAD